MSLFKKKAGKKTFGDSSKISQLSSPYRKTIIAPRGKKTKKNRKTSLAKIPPARLKNTSQRSRGKTLLATILSIGIIAYGIYAVFFSDFFLINNFIVEEEGTIIDNNKEINTILQKTIDKNIVLLSDKELIDNIKTAHPEIETVTVKKIFPSTIKIEYRKYPTVANLVNIVEGVQKKFLVDSQGFLVEENTEHPDLPHIYYETGEFLEVRNSFLSDPRQSQQRLTQIVNAIKLFEEKFAMKILYAAYKKQEREVHLQTEKYFTVMIDLEKDLNRQIEKLKKALPKLDIYNEPLVYIDLRISGTNTEKVIYKRK
ncbi:FtsQ-type POTRA domain-containing protein [Patescibacteria group bacterium]|nr:FtsQ-type POTRA domain-containing protein [Patescibacteria group bacterium]MBU1703167.1 FtsQ-type POTRA domain-containing protein [Patescibacteria group bacterium]MBU1954316.1 FtsQ-type POTRA domain-containing protein [Patescibacteria group bacterium]